MLFNGMLENNCSEQASRMAAMESSTKNAKEMLAKLTLSYNRCVCLCVACFAMAPTSCRPVRTLLVPSLTMRKVLTPASSTSRLVASSHRPWNEQGRLHVIANTALPDV